jgi:cysteine synthase
MAVPEAIQWVLATMPKVPCSSGRVVKGWLVRAGVASATWCALCRDGSHSRPPHRADRQHAAGAPALLKLEYLNPLGSVTGIGLASAAAAGIRLILVMPERVSAERIRLAKLLGCIARAEELQRRIPTAVILQQFRNPANPAIHERTTGPEVWRDSGGRLDEDGITR